MWNRLTNSVEECKILTSFKAKLEEFHLGNCFYSILAELLYLNPQNCFICFCVYLRCSYLVPLHARKSASFLFLTGQNFVQITIGLIKK